MKIYEYSLEDCTVNKYINEEEIKAGMQLRIEGRISEVENLLKQMNYEIITEGHETDTLKRVYIKVLSTEIQVKEYMTNKEFKETVRRAERFESIEGIAFEELKLKTIVWHTCDGVYGEIYLANEEEATLLEIAYIDGLSLRGRSLYQTLDNQENTNNVLKATKKAFKKYSKRCENFNINIEEIKEENC
jgi:hypothetical protein